MGTTIILHRSGGTIARVPKYQSAGVIIERPDIDTEVNTSEDVRSLYDLSSSVGSPET